MDLSLPDVPKGCKAIHNFFTNRDKAVQVLVSAVKIYRGRHVP